MMREFFFKIWSTLSGVVVCFGLFFIYFYLVVHKHFLIGSSQEIPSYVKVFMSPYFVNLLIFPACVFLGGLVAGFVSRPFSNHRFLDLLLIGPGVYFFVIALISLLMERRFDPAQIAGLLIALVVSIFGVKFGGRIRAARGTQGEKPLQDSGITA